MLPTADLESFYRGRRIGVTGGAGFIGSHLTDALVHLGAQVTVLDDFSSGDEANLAGAVSVARLVRGSLMDDAALADSVRGASIVFHQAALASVPRSVAEPVRFTLVNVLGTARLIEAARAAGVQRIVFASSSSVYGDQPASPKTETMPLAPLSPYAATKCAGEHLIHAACRSQGIDGVSLRYFNVFGPRQSPDSAYAAVVPRWIAALHRGEQPVIYGDGTQTRDFTFIADVVTANLLAGAAPRPLGGAAVNIAAGAGRSLLELLDALRRRLGAAETPVFEPPRAGDIAHSLADVSAARTLIGYEPSVPFETGLDRTIEWFTGPRCGAKAAPALAGGTPRRPTQAR